jgi:hypothetical protein
VVFKLIILLLLILPPLAILVASIRLSKKGAKFGWVWLGFFLYCLLLIIVCSFKEKIVPTGTVDGGGGTYSTGPQPPMQTMTNSETTPQTESKQKKTPSTSITNPSSKYDTGKPVK